MLSDKNKGLTLSDQNGNSIEMNNNGIRLRSKTDISIEADANCTTRAGQSWSATAASMAKLKADGVTEIKGGMVKIN